MSSADVTPAVLSDVFAVVHQGFELDDAAARPALRAHPSQPQLPRK